MWCEYSLKSQSYVKAQIHKAIEEPMNELEHQELTEPNLKLPYPAPTTQLHSHTQNYQPFQNHVHPNRGINLGTPFYLTRVMISSRKSYPIKLCH